MLHHTAILALTKIVNYFENILIMFVICHIWILVVLRHFDWRLQTPHLQDYYPRYTDHCSLIAQRVSIRNLLSVLYSAIYSHYCCYILIHCAACTQVDHPSILYPCTNCIFIYYFQTTYVSKVFIDQFLLKVSLLSLATTNYLPREKANQKKLCV